MFCRGVVNKRYSPTLSNKGKDKMESKKHWSVKAKDRRAWQQEIADLVEHDLMEYCDSQGWDYNRLTPEQQSFINRRKGQLITGYALMPVASPPIKNESED